MKRMVQEREREREREGERVGDDNRVFVRRLKI